MLVLMAMIPGALRGQDLVTDQPIDPAKEAAIRTLLEVSHTGEIMVTTLQSALQDVPPDPDLPDGFNDAVRNKAQEKIGEFLDMMVPIYDQLYTLQQINDQIAFYRTPSGQAVVEKATEMTQLTMEAGEQWGMLLAGEVIVDLVRKGNSR
jgi:hypothetical protein